MKKTQLFVMLVMAGILLTMHASTEQSKPGDLILSDKFTQKISKILDNNEQDVNAVNNIVGLNLSLPKIGSIGKNVYGISFGLPVSEHIKDIYGADLAFVSMSDSIYGLQSSLLVNKSEDIKGLQFGLVNDVENSTGLQTGAINVDEVSSSMQLALINVIRNNEYGAQAALINVVEGKGYGVQTGLINVIRDDGYGLQTGLINVSTQSFSGAQFGLIGFIKSVNGMQTGLINACKSFRGLQIGIYNSAEESKGFQVGLINHNEGAWIPYFPVINLSFN